MFSKSGSGPVRAKFGEREHRAWPLRPMAPNANVTSRSVRVQGLSVQLRFNSRSNLERVGHKFVILYSSRRTQYVWLAIDTLYVHPSSPLGSPNVIFRFYKVTSVRQQLSP